MVPMAAADASDAAKTSPPASEFSTPVSPSSAAVAASSRTRTRTRLHDFSFPTLSWGAHRLLRCSKDGAQPCTRKKHPITPSPEKDKPKDQAGASQPQRPWNLRIRRSATAEPVASRSEGAGKVSAASGQPPQHPAPPSTELRKRGISVALTKEEIAEDFLAIRGARPPRRPKKRPRAVQRQLDALFPGLLLSDVNLDLYKIDER